MYPLEMKKKIMRIFDFLRKGFSCVLRRHGSKEGSDDDNPPPSTLPAEPSLECAPQSATTTEGDDTSSDELVEELARENSNAPEVER